MRLAVLLASEITYHICWPVLNTCPVYQRGLGVEVSLVQNLFDSPVFGFTFNLSPAHSQAAEPWADLSDKRLEA